MSNLAVRLLPLEGQLEAFQTVPYDHKNSYQCVSTGVGGYIELVRIVVEDTLFHMYINEEGKLNGLPYNYIATDLAHESNAISWLDGIVGPAYIISSRLDAEGYEYGLNPKEVAILNRAVTVIKSYLGGYPEADALLDSERAV